jgi:hypothetical protein
MPNGRPLWELKAVATLLLAVSLLSRLFGIITQEVFNSILLSVVNLFLINTSTDLMVQYIEKFKVHTFFMKVDWAVKIVCIPAVIVVFIGYQINVVSYDIMLKFMGIVATILLTNIAYYEHKLSR